MFSDCSAACTVRKLAVPLLGVIAVLMLLLLFNGWRAETVDIVQETTAIPTEHPRTSAAETTNKNRFSSKKTSKGRNSDVVKQTELAKPKKQVSKRKFPSSIIIGVKKGGTRALISMLSVHPQIKIAREEVQFFSYNFEKGINWYLEQMPEAGGKNMMTMEKSPNYFDLSYVPPRVFSHSKTVKLILILRNPVDRAVSDYVQYVDQHSSKSKIPKFESMVVSPSGKVISNDRYKFIGRSMYDVHYRNWRTYFNKNQLLVLNGDDLISKPAVVLQKVEKFLKIPSFFNENMFVFDNQKGFYCWNKFIPGSSSSEDNNETVHCLGSSKGRPHPEISEDVKAKLNKFFRPHMRRFCEYASLGFTWCDLQ